MMKQLKIQKSITSRNSEALDRYLSEIARERQLTPDEEVELASKIHKGGKEGEQAKEKLIKANLRFVVSVAKQYQRQGLPLIDLINDGNIGLVKAAEKFDETRGFKFISYAVWWIRQSIIEALAEKSHIVRIPLNQVGTSSKILRATDKYVQEHGHIPSAQELAAMTGIDEEKIAFGLDLNIKSYSIDAPLGNDSDSGSMADSLVSNDEDSSTDRALEEEFRNKEIRNILKDLLDARELKIMLESFGIGTPQKQLDEIAEEMDMSRERVRQIRERSLRKIRTSKASGYLKQYLG